MHAITIRHDPRTPRGPVSYDIAAESQAHARVYGYIEDTIASMVGTLQLERGGRFTVHAWLPQRNGGTKILAENIASITDGMNLIHNFFTDNWNEDDQK